MAIDINFVKTSVELISNKVQSTGAFTVNDFNNACEVAQLDEIKAQRKIFESGLISSDNLSSLKKVVSLQVSSSGVVVQPSDYLYYSTARVKYFVDNESKERDIDVVKENEVGFRLSSQVNPVSKRFPIMAIRNDSFQVFPSDVNNLVLTYIKTPTTPEWKYTTVSGRPVYDSATSVNFELPKELTTDIIYRICQILGIRVKRQDLVQYGIAKEQEIS
jgi:hypothetical protein